MHALYQSTPVSPQFLLCAPKIAGLLPARVQSTEAQNPNLTKVLFEDARLAHVSPEQFTVFAAATERLLRAAVDYLRDPEQAGKLHMASQLFNNELDLMLNPEVQIVKPPKSKPGRRRYTTLEEINAGYESVAQGWEDFYDLLKRTREGRDEQ